MSVINWVLTSVLMAWSLQSGTADTASPRSAPVTPTALPVATAADPVIAAAGDIGCGTTDPSYNGGLGTPAACRMKYTSDLLVNGGYTGVLALGDTMQADPTASGYATVYDPTWGRVKAITHPVPGNHEYALPGASGYFGYFGSAAGDPAKGYYSFDIGAWHLIALNSNCAQISGGCAAGGAEETWLRADLAAHPGQCTLAFDHHPRYSSGHEGDSTFLTDLYQDLYNAGADLLLSGHSHDYERFEPQNNAAQLDLTGGITQFVVGTGGSFFTGLGTRHPNSVASQNDTFGVLALTLHQTSFDWRFVPEAGKTWTDSGTRNCHHGQLTDDFALSANPSAVTIAPGGSGNVSIGSTVTSGVAQSITLTASGLPTGVSATFNPSTITAGSSSTMTITVAAGTLPSSSTVTVTGMGSSASHTVTVGLTVGGGGSTVRLVQSAGATETAATTTLTTTLPASSTTGDLLVLTVAGYTGATNNIASVTDTAGNAWTKVGAYFVSGHYSEGELWFCPNAKAVTSVTVRSSTALVQATTVLEFSGIAAISPLDKAVGTAGTSKTANSGSITPAAGELLVGFAAGHGNTQSMTVTTAGFSALAQRTSAASTSASVRAGYQVGAGGTPVALTATFGTAMYWAAGIAAFHPAG
jgi:calcineurin-like phosphoesterase family protein